MGRPSNQEAHPLLHSLQEPILLMLPPSLNYRPLDTGQHLLMLRNLRTTTAPLAFKKRPGKPFHAKLKNAGNGLREQDRSRI